MMNCIIIDDEPKSCETLKKILYNYCQGIEVKGTAHNAIDGAALASEVDHHLVFLDVEMPGGDGFHFLNQFAEVPFRTVFTTAYDHYAIRAIKYAAFDYLLKPLSIEQVRATVEKAQSMAGSIPNLQPQYNLLRSAGAGMFNKLAIPTSAGFEFLEFSEIVWLQACDSYCVMHLKNKVQLVSTYNLGHYEDLLQQQPFLRIHHSHMINLNHVTRLYKNKNISVLMSDGKELDVSTRKKDTLLSLVNH